MNLFMDSCGDGYWHAGGSGNNPAGLQQNYPAIAIAASISVTASGRTGNGLLMGTDDELVVQVRAAPNTADTFFVGHARRFNALPAADTRILHFSDTADVQNDRQISVSYGPTGLLKLWRGAVTSGTLIATSATTFAPGSFHYIEFSARIDNSPNGSYALYVNEQLVFEDASEDTFVDAGCAFIGIVTGTLTGDIIDDIYINDNVDDGTGLNLGFWGNTKIMAKLMAAEGDLKDFTPLSGTDRALMIDDPAASPCPDGDTTYNSHAAPGAGESDTFTWAAISGIAAPKAVQLVGSFKSDDASQNAALRLRKAGVNYDGTASAIGTSSYVKRRWIWQRDPAAAAVWTLVALNAFQAGYVHTA